jgi:uncharacterized membrane protein (DUF4010 family)
LQETLLQLGLALAIGLLVGVERHWRERDAVPGSRTAGLRTFGLSGLLGGVAALTAQVIGGGVPGAIVFAAVLAAYSAALIAFKLYESLEDSSNSVTTVVAGILVFVLGAMAVLGDRTVTAAAGVTMTALLASRDLLHGLLRRLTWIELRSAIIILVMSLVVLPLVPRAPVGPFGGVDLAEVWTLAILMAGISYAGYVAVKLLGAREGLLLAGALGGLASSTAVTLTSARRAKAGEAPPLALVSGALAASSVAVLRIGMLALVMRPELIPTLALALVAASATFAGTALTIARRAGATEALSLSYLENPFDLPVILRFTLFIVLAAFLVKAGTTFAGGMSVVPLAGLAGLADADAVVLSVARLSGADLPITTVALAISAAIAADISAKTAYALALGGRQFGRTYALAALAAVIAGGSALWLATS